MINEINEDMGGGVRTEDWAWGGLVTKEDLEEVLLIDSCSSVVYVALVVHVDACTGGGMVEDLAGEGISWVVSNVVIG